MIGFFQVLRNIIFAQDILHIVIIEDEKIFLKKEINSKEESCKRFFMKKFLSN